MIIIKINIMMMNIIIKNNNNNNNINLCNLDSVIKCQSNQSVVVNQIVRNRSTINLDRIFSKLKQIQINNNYRRKKKI